MVRGLSSLNGLLKWKPLNDVSITLDAANLAGTSGRYYNDFSALVTTENIYWTQPDTDIVEAGFNQALKDLVSQSIAQLMNSVFNEDDLIENGLLYPYEMDFENTIENDTSFVGFEINHCNSKVISSLINDVRMTFNGDDTVKLLVFRSDKKAVLYSQNVSVLENDTVTQELTDFVLEGQSNSGKYYVGYLRSGLTAKAYNREYELANLPNSFTAFNFQPIKVAGWNSEEMFDVNDINHASETWGLNFDLSVWKDWTSVVVKNKNKFVDAIGMQVCINALDMFLNSPRSNRDERIAKANIMVALDGYKDQNGFYTQGLRQRLNKEIKALRKSFVEPALIQTGTLC